MNQGFLLFNQLLDAFGDFCMAHLMHCSKVDPIPNPRLTHYIVLIKLKIDERSTLNEFYAFLQQF